METVTLKRIHEDLESLKRQIIDIKENMVNVDTILTQEDIESLQEAEKDLKERKTKRLD